MMHISKSGNNWQNQQTLNKENLLQTTLNDKSSQQRGFWGIAQAAQALVSLGNYTLGGVSDFEPSKIASTPIYQHQQVDFQSDLEQQPRSSLETSHLISTEVVYDLPLPPLSPLSSLSDLSICDVEQTEDQTTLLQSKSNSSEQNENSNEGDNENTISYITLQSQETRIKAGHATESGLENQCSQHWQAIKNTGNANVRQLNARSCRAALRHLRNEEVEEKEQGIFQGIEILYKRLQATGFTISPINTNRSILNHTFTRDFLSSTYGGNTIDTYPRVDLAKIWKGGYQRFMCLNLLYNPHAPQFPGAPGLYYALRDPRRWPNRKELVISRYGPNRWNLMGKYQITRSQPLSGKEFASLDKDVKQTWMDNIWAYQWGNFTLAAIYLRRARGREPSDAEIARYAKTKESFLKRNVSPAQVKKAFMDGQEKFNVWTMKYIGYDEPFKRRLVPKALLKVAERQTVQGDSRGPKRKRHASLAGEETAGGVLRRRRV